MDFRVNKDLPEQQGLLDNLEVLVRKELPDPRGLTAKLQGRRDPWDQ